MHTKQKGVAPLTVMGEQDGGLWLGIESGKTSRIKRLNRWIDRNPLRAIMASVGLVLLMGAGSRVARSSYVEYQANAPMRQVEAQRAAIKEELDRQAARHLDELRDFETKTFLESMSAKKSSDEVCPSRGFECLTLYYTFNILRIMFVFVLPGFAFIGFFLVGFRHASGQ